MTPLSELVDAYLRYLHEKREDLYWAWEEVSDLVREQPESAWEVVTALVDQAKDRSQLAYIAAGPLEDLIHAHGELFVDRIGVQSRGSAQFRRALRGVWCWDDLPQDLRARFQRIPGVPTALASRRTSRGRTRRRR